MECQVCNYIGVIANAVGGYINGSAKCAYCLKLQICDNFILNETNT